MHYKCLEGKTIKQVNQDNGNLIIETEGGEQFKIKVTVNHSVILTDVD